MLRMLGFSLVGFAAPFLLFLAVAMAINVPWQVLLLSGLAVLGATAAALASFWSSRGPERGPLSRPLSREAGGNQAAGRDADGG